MVSKEIRTRFFDFFTKRGHKIVPSSSLIPDDPSVLLTTAGMQQFKKYFTGELDPMKDFGSENVVSIQKCFRTSDIDEVGDESHLTFFEMLGNFSFAAPATLEPRPTSQDEVVAGGRSDGGRGGYWKKEAIEYAHEFITKEMDLKIDYVSVFKGDSEVPADLESEKVWKSLGISEIKKFGREDNFWGPTGSEGPCGPTTEIYVKNAAGQSIEIWNLVFNEYYSKDGKLTPLKIKGVDTGMGLERLAMVSQKVPTIFETDLFSFFNKLWSEAEQNTSSGCMPEYDYHGSFAKTVLRQTARRIISDHIRGIIFLTSDGVTPFNKSTGYVLRKLIRRIVVYGYQDFSRDFEKVFERLFKPFFIAAVQNYKNFYPELDIEKILQIFKEESQKFEKTLKNGLKAVSDFFVDNKEIDAGSAFKIYESYGLPYEIIKEFGGKKALNLTREDFDKEFAKHQEISRAGAEKKFGGHGLLLNTGELKAGNEDELKKVTRLHTATHLLHQALRIILSDSVGQMGSDITPERTRFDFSFSRRLTPEEIKKIEELVNQKIKEDLPVNFIEMPKNEAEKTGALYFSREKYPEKVKVYFVGELLENAWSKEFCGGPHVSRTSEISEFRILKEEAVAAGVRRIRATVL